VTHIAGKPSKIEHRKIANGYCKVRLIVAVVVFIFITLLYIELLLFPARTRTHTRTSFSYHDPSIAFSSAFRQMQMMSVPAP